MAPVEWEYTFLHFLFSLQKEGFVCLFDFLFRIWEMMYTYEIIWEIHNSIYNKFDPTIQKYHFAHI